MPITTDLNELSAAEVGDNHLSSRVDAPLRPDAFTLSDTEKEARIAEHFGKIMETLGLDLTDDSLRGTPERVARLYVRDYFKGLNPENLPKLTTFANRYAYGHLVVEKNIRFYSACEHHFLPIIGTAHVGYLPKERVIGLSKINRLVKHFARQPQVQERHTRQIAEALSNALGTEDVAVVLDAKHTCVMTRGVSDEHSSTVTVEFRGRFEDPAEQQRFLDYIRQPLMTPIE